MNRTIPSSLLDETSESFWHFFLEMKFQHPPAIAGGEALEFALEVAVVARQHPRVGRDALPVAVIAHQQHHVTALLVLKQRLHTGRGEKSF